MRAAAAHALALLGRREQAVAAIIAELDRTTDDYVSLNAVNALTHIDALSTIPDAWVTRILAEAINPANTCDAPPSAWPSNPTVILTNGCSERARNRDNLHSRTLRGNDPGGSVFEC